MNITAITYPTEPDTSITIGDRARSFDYRFSDDDYVEGTVVEMPEVEGCQCYKIRVERIVRNGQEVNPGANDPKFVFPPVNGSSTWSGRETCGVSKL